MKDDDTLSVIRIGSFLGLLVVIASIVLGVWSIPKAWAWVTSPSEVETNAIAWCKTQTQDCEVVECDRWGRCEVRLGNRPIYRMDCRGKKCSW